MSGTVSRTGPVTRQVQQHVRSNNTSDPTTCQVQQPGRSTKPAGPTTCQVQQPGRSNNPAGPTTCPVQQSGRSNNTAGPTTRQVQQHVRSNSTAGPATCQAGRAAGRGAHKTMVYVRVWDWVHHNINIHMYFLCLLPKATLNPTVEHVYRTRRN